MDIYEYQAKKIFRDLDVPAPYGFIAYTPNEAKQVAFHVSHDGPWVVKAQILAGSRDIGKFSDRRAGRRGGIRLSKTLDEVYQNADEMLENMLITNQTGAKGRLVSRVYVEEYIKTIKKFYVCFVIDRITASTVLLLTPVSVHMSDDILSMSMLAPDDILKVNLGLQKELTPSQISLITRFMNFEGKKSHLKSFFNKVLNVFYLYDATMLEISPIGITKDNRILALDAKIVFDQNALYRHREIQRLTDETGIDERVKTAAQFGFQYRELNNGIGIISNGCGLAFNMINEAKKQDLDTACFLNLKGGVDRDKITASIKLIMTNPKVDGIFINILGGFLRCNLIADGIIAVANDLGLNIPLVVRFEGTNKEEAINILQSSGLPLKIATNTFSGLEMLKKAIAEDL